MKMHTIGSHPCSHLVISIQHSLFSFSAWSSFLLCISCLRISDGYQNVIAMHNYSSGVTTPNGATVLSDVYRTYSKNNEIGSQSGATFSELESVLSSLYKSAVNVIQKASFSGSHVIVATSNWISASHKPGQSSKMVTRVVKLNLHESVANVTRSADISCRRSNLISDSEFSEAISAIFVKPMSEADDLELFVTFAHPDSEQQAGATNTYAALCRFSLSEFLAEPPIGIDKQIFAIKQETMKALPFSRVLLMHALVVDDQSMVVLQGQERIEMTSADLLLEALTLDNNGDQNYLHNITSVTVDQPKKELYVKTDKLVLRYDLNPCAKLTTCEQCLQKANEHCGWCILESRTPYENDKTFMFWIKASVKNPSSCPGMMDAKYAQQVFAVGNHLWDDDNSPVRVYGLNFPSIESFKRTVTMVCTFYLENGHLEVTAVRLKQTQIWMLPVYVCTSPSNTSWIDGIVTSGSTNIKVALGYQLKNRTVPLHSTTLKAYNCSVLPCRECGEASTVCRWSQQENRCSILPTTPWQDGFHLKLKTDVVAKHTLLDCGELRVPYVESVTSATTPATHAHGTVKSKNLVWTERNDTSQIPKKNFFDLVLVGSSVNFGDGRCKVLQLLYSEEDCALKEKEAATFGNTLVIQIETENATKCLVCANNRTDKSIITTRSIGKKPVGNLIVVDLDERMQDNDETTLFVVNGIGIALVFSLVCAIVALFRIINVVSKENSLRRSRILLNYPQAQVPF